jgi:DNA-directed RNA polymerase subunit alpha
MLEPNFFTKEEKITDEYARFIFEPLPPSFGHSFGNILRRSLLSSIEGAAVTDIRFSGVSHLFSTIKGVKESVLEIVLNFKKLRFKTPQSRGSFKISLVKKGKGMVYAKEIKGEVEVVNKDQYLFEITNPQTEVEIEAYVSRGYGFLAVEDREDRRNGFIAVDSFFSPIIKVNFRVEPARVGKKDNFERLILEIWSDKTVNPKEALKEVTQKLSLYFTHIFSEKAQSVAKETKKEERTSVVENQRLKEIIIDELNFPSRVVNALLREGIETVADLVAVGRDKIEKMKGVGKKSIKLIDEELKKVDVELK